MKSVHYNKRVGDGLYRAISVILGDRERATADDVEEARSELRRFKDWLGTTDAGHGLTAELPTKPRPQYPPGFTVQRRGSLTVVDRPYVPGGPPPVHFATDDEVEAVRLAHMLAVLG